MHNLNSTLPNANEFVAGPLPVEYLLAFFTIGTVESLVAVIGNTLTLISILKYEDLQTVHNLYVASLAVGDLFGCLAFCATLATYITGVDKWTQWFNLCRLSLLFTRVFNLGNAISTFFIAIDRYIFIIHPLRYHSIMNWEKSVKICIAAWIAMLAVPILSFSFLFQSNGETETYCFDGVMLHRTASFTMFAFIFLPTLITAVLYSKILIIARRQQRQIRAEQERFGTSFPMSTGRRMTFTLGLTVAVYVLTTLPLYVIGAFQKRYAAGKVVTRTLGLIYRSNTALNPIFLAWKQKEFRKAYKRLLRIRQVESI